MTNSDLLNIQFLQTLLESSYELEDEDKLNDIISKSNDIFDLISTDSTKEEADEISDDLIGDTKLDDLVNELDKDYNKIDNDEDDIIVNVNLLPDRTKRRIVRVEVDNDDKSDSDTKDTDDSNATIIKTKLVKSAKLKDTNLAADSIISSLRNKNLEEPDNENEEVIGVNLKRSDTDSSLLSNNKEVAVNVKLHKSSKNNDTSNDKDPNTLTVKLKNAESSLSDEDEQIFFQKRDELIKSEDTSLKLSVCIKTLVQLKDSLDKLTNYIPKETMLVKTKYVLSDILENIIDNNKMLIKDKDKCNEIIIKMFDLVASLRSYITQRYNELKTKVESSSKTEETENINREIKNIETIKNKEASGEGSSSSPISTKASQSKIVDPNSKVPNINYKKQ